MPTPKYFYIFKKPAEAKDETFRDEDFNLIKSVCPQIKFRHKRRVIVGFLGDTLRTDLTEALKAFNDSGDNWYITFIPQKKAEHSLGFNSLTLLEKLKAIQIKSN